MIDTAVERFGVRGLARVLGVTPAYVSMMHAGKRPLTPKLRGQITELVNTLGPLSVNNGDVGAADGMLPNRRETAMVGASGLEPLTSSL